MKVVCSCGRDLQLSEFDGGFSIYNCPNLDCDGQVIITGDIEVKK